ncbi:hypothetical protein SDC9_68136 [bioreactor metagenome]|uniref:Uncharacterized protein n=1 Tax=bioreactor metagenome TaxID=1076179 RepID=A0A644Y1B8_9ZZZZ
MFMFPELKEVCCIIIPGDSLSTMLMLLEFIAAFSPSSSRVTASIRVGMVSIVLEERVAETITSSSSSPDSMTITIVLPSDSGKRSVLDCGSYPT